MVDDRDVVGVQPADELLRPLPEPGRAGVLDQAHRFIARRDELLAAQHPLQLVAALRVVEWLDPRMRRVAGHLLDPVVGVGDARDLGQVRDRQHLCALGEALQRRRDRVRSLAADAGVDLVEDHRLASSDGGDRERDARELAPGGGLRDRPEREPGVRADQENGLVDARRAGIALAQLDAELPLAHADAAQLLRDGVGERGGGRLPRRAQPGCELRPSSPLRPPAPRLRRRPGRARPRAPPARPGRPQPARAGRRSPLRRSGGVRPRSAPARPRRARAGRAPPPARRGTRGGRSRPRAAAAPGLAAPRRRAASSGASRSSGASERSAAAASPVAPSPSSGASASAARAAPSASSVTCRSRSRSSRSDCSPPASKPSVASTSAVSSRRRASSAAAPRVSSSWRLRAAPSSRHARLASRRRPSCSSPTKASSTSSWYEGRPRRRCSNWPDIAIRRSAAAARSSRATARPQAYARVRPSPKTRRASTRPGLVLGRQLGERGELVVVEESLRARRARPRRRPRCRPRRRCRRPPLPRAGGRWPGSGSSCPRPSRR